MTAEQGERCPVCEGLDQPGLLHNVNAPYCSASTGQGDVAVIREALTSTYHFPLAAQGLTALDRHAAALERVERERDRLIENVQACNERSRNLAEKADRAEKAERALAEIADGSWGRKAQQVNYDVAEFARAALLPSEEASDES